MSNERTVSDSVRLSSHRQEVGRVRDAAQRRCGDCIDAIASKGNQNVEQKVGADKAQGEGQESEVGSSAGRTGDLS